MHNFLNTNSAEAARITQILQAASATPQADVTPAEAKELLALLRSVDQVLTFLLNRPVALQLREKLRKLQGTAPSLSIELLLNPARLNRLLREYEEELFNELKLLREQRRGLEHELFRATLARTIKHSQEHQTGVQTRSTEILASLVALVSAPAAQLTQESTMEMSAGRG